MKKIFLAVVLILSTCFVYAQKDQAQTLLKNASEKMASYKTISANFTYLLDNSSAKLNDSQEGKLWIKGDKYILELGQQTILCDGTTVYTILADAQEIQINNLEDMGDMLTPNKIFTEYYQKFNAKSMTSKTIRGVICQVIDLDASQDKDFSKATIAIVKSDLSPKELQLVDKKGTTHTYQLNNFSANQNIEDAKFIFNRNNYAGFELIDMR